MEKATERLATRLSDWRASPPVDGHSASFDQLHFIPDLFYMDWPGSYILLLSKARAYRGPLHS